MFNTSLEICTVVRTTHLQDFFLDFIPGTPKVFLRPDNSNACAESRKPEYCWMWPQTQYY